mgnify:CR=1 FL=1
MEEHFGEFWDLILKPKPKTRRKISKKRKKAKKSAKNKRRIQQVEVLEEELDENNNEIDVLESAGDFLAWAAEDKVIKVKNLASDDIPCEIEAFLSLGPKACPVELDVNIARLDGDIHAFIRRLRLVQLFKDDEDKRDEEE